MYVAIGIIVAIIILMIIAGRESLPQSLGESKVTAPFFRIGAYFYRRIFEDRERQSAYFQKLYDAKNVLNPSGKTGQEVTLFFIKKIGLCLLVLFCGMVIITINSINSSQNEYIENGNQIKRNSYEGKEYDVVLNIQSESSNAIDYTVKVGQQIYTENQLIAMLPEFYEELDKRILGENESADFICKDLNLVEAIDGYPFDITYRWHDKETIKSGGIIGDELPEEGTIVEIEATLSYEDFTEIYRFSFNVFPRDYTEEEYMNYIVSKELEEAYENSKNEEYLVLPEDIQGIKVTWTEKKENHTILFLLLVIASVIAIFIAQDKDLYKKIEERNQQMLEDYPEIVSKLTLLVGAGMTIRGAWKKIAMDYKEKREAGFPHRYAYEEMLFTLYEMESGVEETICYSHFSMRARVQKYVKLVSLLDQNLKMGSKGLIANLRSESRDAFEERKLRAEKKGEEAGTKLLVPMMLMLVVVMVVIMVPAFMSM